MPITHSPLRYPGGKTAIFDIVSKVIEDNGLREANYAEPYAGGAGLALQVLFSGFAKKIVLNDIDRSIWAFWDSVLYHSEEFIGKILETPITIDEWYKQKNIQSKKNNVNTLELGFSTFFLNRTNRSGIIKAGVIGGIKQESDYKLNCRFNKNNLIEKIKMISAYKDRISILNMDANDFIANINENEDNIFLCIDPPYYVKGASLYTNFYEKDDHVNLRNAVFNNKHPWIMTYDNTIEIQNLYSDKRRFTFNLNYSAGSKKKGEEIMIFCDKINIPESLVNKRIFPFKDTDKDS
ncbi:DNA adenine methylase [Photorhabdus luminescens]|uniref:site-specific DNA-methyltransferase (adenine-specific) n=1 Tax=Photorhabdus luminescens subsp. mexicana TaxID=2100167 RepID=A0A4R4IXD5_PHOLU|nr:DNA adenine methylase [Photorhabdus luminescens]TDB45670.1 DNA methyltransferase [Photorhabdus luminescens subsp. mexicana]